jgi:hypothetical protein
MEYFSYLTSQSGAGLLRTSHKSVKYVQQLIQRFVACGWDYQYIQSRLEGLTDTMLRDYSEEEMILGAVRQWYNENTSTLYDGFILIGITSRTAKQLSSLMYPLENTCYTDIQLIEKAIEYKLGFHTSSYPENTTHPFSPNLILQSFSLPDTQAIKAVNIPFRCYERHYPKVKTILSENYKYLPTQTYYYHTTSWTFATLIMEELSHTAGRKCLDFGSTPGFYVSPSLQDAVQWGEKNIKVWSYEVAILIFSVPKKMPNTIRYKELEGDEWSSVMKFSRKCKYPTITAKEIRGYDIIGGDMLENVKNVKNGQEPLTHVKPKYQIASKTTAGDQFLQNCLTGCLYFQKNTQKLPTS